MRIFADLHIHSKYSRAVSKDMDIVHLEKYARIKGLGLLGTGDFTHPLWLKELKSSLAEENGILKTKTGFPFMLQTEISSMYSQDGKGRKVHNIIFAKNFEIVDQINAALLKKGRLDYDGRPMFGIPCPELVEMLKDIDKSIEIVPAHAWTPYFSLFGSKSGFDSVKDCFLEQTKHIFALETGLSSDPEMNWRLSQLDNISLISNSDSHSYWPWRIGRECNVFELKELTYDNVIRAMKTRQGFVETIEVDPSYGKYHYDGHRACNVCFEPSESLKHKNICPKCKKPLTIGVLNRVEELADRKQGFVPDGRVPFKRMIPLQEVIAPLVGAGIATQKTWQEYNKLILAFGNEFHILLDADYDELAKVTTARIAQMIIANRENKIKISPGYDGEYGYPVFDENKKKEIKLREKQSRSTPKLQKQGQVGLDRFM